MAFRLLRLLLHVEYPHLLVHDDDTRPLQLLYRRLFVAHDTRGSFLLGKVDKFLEREEQQIVCCDHQQVVVNVQLLHRKQQVADGTQAGIVGFCTVVHNGDGLLVVLFFRPLLKDGGKLMVRDHDMLVNLRNAVDVVQHTSKNGVLSYFQQRFRKVSGQLTQSGGITCCYHNILHNGN